jgi:hypothetical protein
VDGAPSAHAALLTPQLAEPWRGADEDEDLEPALDAVERRAI